MRYPQTNPTNRPIAQAMSNKISSSVINEKKKWKKRKNERYKTKDSWGLGTSIMVLKAQNVILGHYYNLF